MSVLEPHREGPDTESLIKRVIEIVEGARSSALSSSVRLDNRVEVLELLDAALDHLPEEYREARWLVKEKQEFLERMQREADDIVEAARLRAERMVQRTEIVREAGHAARRLMEDARDEARRLRLEAEDYCDQKLAEFEIVLDRTIKTVAAGRVKLSAHPQAVTEDPGVIDLDRPGSAEGPGVVDGPAAFFDQDRRG
jgi:vacuolar-type H+-ATPase subunit E/Vma4